MNADLGMDRFIWSYRDTNNAQVDEKCIPPTLKSILTILRKETGFKVIYTHMISNAFYRFLPRGKDNVVKATHQHHHMKTVTTTVNATPLDLSQPPPTLVSYHNHNKGGHSQVHGLPVTTLHNKPVKVVDFEVLSSNNDSQSTQDQSQAMNGVPAKGTAL